MTGAGRLPALPVRQQQGDLSVPAALRLHGIGNDRRPFLQAEAHAVIRDGLRGRPHQPDAAVDSRVVEKVKVSLGELCAVRLRPHRAGGNAGFVQLVVRQHRQPVAPGSDQPGDLRGHRQESALVLPGQLPVQEDPAPVGHAAEADRIPFVRPHLLGVDIRLVPEVAAVVPLRGLGEEIREAGGHRHGNRIRQSPAGPVLRHALAPRVKPEPPQPVQPLCQPDFIADRIQF